MSTCRAARGLDDLLRLPPDERLVAEEVLRVEVPLHRDVAEFVPRVGDVDRPVEADGVRVGVGERVETARHVAHEEDDGRVDARADPAVERLEELAVVRGREFARVGVEQLNDVRAVVDLVLERVEDGVRDDVEERAEGLGVARAELPNLVVTRRPAGDDVRGEGERTAGEADEGLSSPTEPSRRSKSAPT